MIIYICVDSLIPARVRDDESSTDQLSADRRSAALIALSRVLTFQSIAQWHRVVSRVLAVSASELYYYCACALVRTALSDINHQRITTDNAQDLSTDPASFELLLGELFNVGMRKMSFNQICAFLDCVTGRPFSAERYAGLVYMPLHAWESSTFCLSARDQRSMFDALHRVLLAVDVDEEYRDEGVRTGPSTRSRQKSFSVAKDEFISVLSIVKERIDLLRKGLF